jgi:Mg-chelatase subunit ChlD
MRAVLVALTGAVLVGLVVLVGLLVAPASPAVGQEAGASLFKIDLESVTPYTEKQGNSTVRMVKVIFTITPLREDAGDVSKYKIRILEDGKPVRLEDVPQAKKSEDLSVVVAVDVSGSMAEGNRMAQTRGATSVFFQQLPGRAEAGLILFDHNVSVRQPLSKDRVRLLEEIAKARPGGGTAYLDATVKAVEMLRGVRHPGKAVVLLTDGVDLNSTADLPTAIRQAQKAGVKVYTIGIGEPGRQEKVTSMLVLDKSGSMNEPASDQERVPKITALQDAATRFLSFVRETNPPIVRTSVLWFSDEPAVPQPFTNMRTRLVSDIKREKAKGETALFDATFEALAALEAENPPGKRAIVAMTDGVDNSSRRRVEEVIARAKEAKIPLYMLGFGRQGELDEAVMKRMATETGGKYYHAKNQAELMQIFENLSLKLHDDGIDEAALKELATKTKGKYYAAKDAAQLKFILESVVSVLQPETRTVDFPSLVQIDDGRKRAVTLQLVRVTGEVVGGGTADPNAGVEVVSSGITGEYTVHGLVLPEVNHFVYLGLLALLGILLALPAGFRRLSKSE